MSYKLSLQKIYILLFILFIATTLVSCQKNADRKHILLIQSYEANYPAYEKMNDILSRQFEKLGIHADVYSFYLNSGQYTEKTQRLRIYNKLEEKASWKPDIIIVNDEQATNALLSCKHPLIDSIPVVFSGVNYPNKPLIQRHPNICGFYDKPDYAANFRLIEQILGKCIVVRVNDNTFLDKKIREDMDEQVKDICAPNNIFSPDRVRLSGIRGISIDKVQKVSPDSMYLSTIDIKSNRSLVKGLGENYFNKAYLVTKRDFYTISLGRFCAFPSFTTINEMMGYNSGVTGGYLTTVEEQAQRTAERVASILQGTLVSHFQQITESNKSYVFDYKVLDRWGIDLSRLPSNAQILNMPVYVSHKPYILIGGTLFGLFFIVLVIYQRLQYRRESLRKKEAQEWLKKEKEFLSFALESGNIYTFRYKHGVFEFDKEFYNSLGMPEQPITAEAFKQAIYPEEQQDFLINRHKLDNGFPSRHIIRRRYNFNNKGYQWWEFRYAQNTNIQNQSSDHLVEVNGLCLNIQQIKETEMKLIQARTKAEESDQMKSVFLANMSHEIRTPLNAIVGFSELLATNDIPLDNEEKVEFMDLIKKNSTLLLKLINDILDLSRIESGRLSFSYENCDMNNLIEDIYHTHKLLMPQGVELRRQVPATPAILHTDCHRLTQVVTNFINNATKFTTEGHIEIKYEYGADNQSIVISVSDTGMGIPDEKKALVFERFQKLNEFAQGTGLGLAICMSIVKSFKGHIRLESEVGKGSTFIITLPYTPGLTV